MPKIPFMRGSMDWIFLSPHLDDAVLSCGGFIAERVTDGDSVQIWTICAGAPPAGPLSPFARQLHQRWGTGRNAINIRRTEDRTACQRLGAISRHFPIPDCIYRRDPITGKPLIAVNDDLFSPLPESQRSLVEELKVLLDADVSSECLLVVPLAFGNHIDHQLVRRAAEGLDRPLWYYTDYPYSAQEPDEYSAFLRSAWQSYDQPVSSAGLQVWQTAVADYKSQISTFWGSVSEMEAAIQAYWSIGGGCKLWRKPAGNP